MTNNSKNKKRSLTIFKRNITRRKSTENTISRKCSTKK